MEDKADHRQIANPKYSFSLWEPIAKQSEANYCAQCSSSTCYMGFKQQTTTLQTGSNNKAPVVRTHTGSYCCASLVDVESPKVDAVISQSDAS
jgi:hypothetical protein